MPIWLLERMMTWGASPALVWRDRTFTYADLGARVNDWRERLGEMNVRPGQVIALVGDYSPEACALLLAILDSDGIALPLTGATRTQHEEFLRTSQAGLVIEFDNADTWRSRVIDARPTNPLLRQLADSARPGIIFFSSGSTGDSKAALHDVVPLLEKFRVRRPPRSMLNFLLLDHMGGINTLLHALSNGALVVTVDRRDPDSVCEAIARHRVEVLPTSPTFLTLLLVSGAYRRHDLSSLQLITYGTEVMPESTLHRLHEIFPNVELLQTYGLSEVGVLRTRSQSPTSLWMRVGGEGFETKVVNDTLWIRARSAMLGYLNAPNPFDEDGWMNTGDVVEVEGDHIRVLGRRSEMINVGGQKVYPAEVEDVLLQLANVRDASVYGASDPLVGQVVAARVNLVKEEDPTAFRSRMRAFCRERLASFKIPAKVEIVGFDQFSARYKKTRRA